MKTFILTIVLVLFINYSQAQTSEAGKHLQGAVKKHQIGLVIGICSIVVGSAGAMLLLPPLVIASGIATLVAFIYREVAWIDIRKAGEALAQ